MAIETKKELSTRIDEVLESALKEVNEKAKDLLIQHINTDTYGLGKSARFSKPSINASYLDGTGTPSYEFRDKAWYDSFTSALKEYSFKIFYNATSLSAPSKTHPYLHGNMAGKNDIDRREKLAGLLNVSGIDGGNDWGGKEREPFWDNFMTDLKSQLGKWLYEECKKKGLNIPGLKNAKF